MLELQKNRLDAWKRCITLSHEQLPTSLNFARNTFFKSIDNLSNFLIKALESFKKHKSESNFSLICITDTMSVFHPDFNMNESREV